MRGIEPKALFSTTRTGKKIGKEEISGTEEVGNGKQGSGSQ